MGFFCFARAAAFWAGHAPRSEIVPHSKLDLCSVCKVGIDLVYLCSDFLYAKHWAVFVCAWYAETEVMPKQCA